MKRAREIGILVLAVGLMGGARPAAAQTVAHYRFEEGAGTTLHNTLDGSPHGTHNASFSTNVPGNPVPGTGEPNGYSLRFSGGQRATFAGQNFVLHRGYGNASVEFWIYSTNYTGHRALFWTRTDNTDRNRFNISVNDGGVFHCDYRSPTGVVHTLLPRNGTFTLANGGWTRVGITRTIESPTQHRYRFLKDGVQISSVLDVNPDLPTREGWTISGRTGFEVDAQIDELRLSGTPVDAVPEPSSVLLFLPALGVMARLRRRRDGGD